MSNHRIKSFRGAALGFAIAVQATLGSSPATQSAMDSDPEDRQVVERVCSGCHLPDSVRGTRRSRAQWEEVIEKMVERGARMRDTEYEAAMRHLLRSAGRVNVNTATTSDLVAVLQLSTQDGDRIVAYRGEHGPFPSFDRLLEVPGIDAVKVKEGRAAMEF